MIIRAPGKVLQLLDQDNTKILIIKSMKHNKTLLEYSTIYTCEGYSSIKYPGFWTVKYPYNDDTVYMSEQLAMILQTKNVMIKAPIEAREILKYSGHKILTIKAMNQNKQILECSKYWDCEGHPSTKYPGFWAVQYCDMIASKYLNINSTIYIPEQLISKKNKN